MFLSWVSTEYEIGTKEWNRNWFLTSRIHVLLCTDRQMDGWFFSDVLTVNWPNVWFIELVCVKEVTLCGWWDVKILELLAIANRWTELHSSLNGHSVQLNCFCTRLYRIHLFSSSFFSPQGLASRSLFSVTASCLLSFSCHIYLHHWTVQALLPFMHRREMETAPINVSFLPESYMAETPREGQQSLPGHGRLEVDA